MNRLFELTERHTRLVADDRGKACVIIDLQQIEEDLHDISQEEGQDYNLAQELIGQHVEKTLLKWYLSKKKGNITDTALAIGWSRGKTTNRIKKYNIHNYGRKQDD